MSKTKDPKIRCVDCRFKLKKSANFCTACGTRRGSVGKAFYQEADPAIREFAWKTAHAPMMTKVAKSVAATVWGQ